MPSQKERAPVLVLNDLAEHPATRAWSNLRGTSAVPDRIESFQALRPHRRSLPLIYRLYGLAPGRALIAKHCLRTTAEIELRVYAEILPALQIGTLRFYGSVADCADTEKVWFFLEDGGECQWRKTVAQDRLVAAEWLAMLHTRAAQLPLVSTLPDRGPAHYLNHLRCARQNIQSTLERVAVPDADRDVQCELVGLLDSVEAQWSATEEFCAGIASTLVHGDFVEKNVRLRPDGSGRSEIMCFDWETAGWGPPAADLASIDADRDHAVSSAYRHVAQQLGSALVDDQLKLLAEHGRLMRLLSAVYWDSLAVANEYLPRYGWRMRAYRDHLRTHLAMHGRSPQVTKTPLATSSEWSRKVEPRANERRRSAEHAQRLPASDSLQWMLAGMIDANGGALQVLHRERNWYTSTAPTEVVTCRIAAGEDLQVFCKYFFSDIVAADGRSASPFYEVLIYRHLLRPPVPMLRVYGTAIDDEAGTACLVLEFLTRARRLTHVIDQRAAMEAAARWIALFHNHAAELVHAPELNFLRRLDGSYFRSRLRGVIRTVDVGEHPWLVKLEKNFDSCVTGAIDEGQTVIHAEYYPKNILVRDAQVYPIDWETASIGPAEIDLAMLTMNWPAAIAEACINTYIEARRHTGAPADIRRRLAVASMLVNIHWLGYSVAPGCSRKVQASTVRWFELLRQSAAALRLV